MYAIQNNSLVLGLFRVGPRDSPKFPHVDDPRMQSGITPCFVLGLFRVGRQDSSEFPRMDDPCMQTGTTPCFSALPSLLMRLFRVRRQTDIATT